MKRVLVYGFYGKENFGDELFKDAFRHLWPEFDFRFVNKILQKDIDETDAIIFGGGSFLYARPNVTYDVKFNTKILYVGVGGETEIDDLHKYLMGNAELVSLRTPEFIPKIAGTLVDANRVIASPDIVFSLKRKLNLQREKRAEKSLLVLPNAECVPRASDPHWKHLGWEHYKNEFAQALDELREEGYKLMFASMCENESMSDAWAISEIVARMDKRKRVDCVGITVKGLLTKSMMEEFSCVVTQRLHGAVIADLANLPYVVVHHHDKLRTLDPCTGVKQPYFEMSKRSILNAIKFAEYQGSGLNVDVIDARFSELQEKVRTIMAT